MFHWDEATRPLFQKRMTNAEKLTQAVTEWANPMIKDIAAQLISSNQNVVVANEWIRKYFPVSESYTIWNDIQYIATPLFEIGATQLLAGGLQKLGINDEMIPDYACRIIDAMTVEADSKGKIQLLERYSFTAEEIHNLQSKIQSTFNR